MHTSLDVSIAPSLIVGILAAMYREYQRAMNLRERAMLESWAARTEPVYSFDDAARWFILWSGGLSACIAGTGVAVAWTHPVIGVLIGSPLGLAAIFCLYMAIQSVLCFLNIRAFHQDFLRNTRPQLLLAMDCGDVAVKTVSATAVIEISEYEDEGNGYLFDIGEGKTFFVKGQEYESVDEEMPWPNTEFEIVRTIPGNLWVGLFCHGLALKPIRTMEMSDCLEKIVWANEREQVLQQSLEQASRSIERSDQ